MAQKTREAGRKRRHRSVRAKVVGSGDRPRLNVFRSLGHIYAQVINDQTGETLAAASSLDPELKPALQGMPKADRAKRVGQLIAERARSKGIQRVVFDRGGYRYHGRVRALAESARQAGLEF